MAGLFVFIPVGIIFITRSALIPARQYTFVPDLFRAATDPISSALRSL